MKRKRIFVLVTIFIAMSITVSITIYNGVNGRGKRLIFNSSISEHIMEYENFNEFWMNCNSKRNYYNHEGEKPDLSTNNDATLWDTSELEIKPYYLEDKTVIYLE